MIGLTIFEIHNGMFLQMPRNPDYCHNNRPHAGVKETLNN